MIELNSLAENIGDMQVADSPVYGEDRGEK
jgi:hypothetical protein